MQPAVARAQTIIAPNPTTDFEGYNAGQPTDAVTAVSVADPAVPFTTALRIKRGIAGANTFDAAVIWPTRTAVKKGDLLLATYWV